jgi:predicted O-methyltransferase YrrM
MLKELRHDLWMLERAARAAPHVRKLPGRMLWEIFPGVDDRPITIAHHYEPRGLPYGEAYVLSLIAAHVKPARIFEIGTGTGGSTVLMADQAPDARIDTLDLGAEDSSLGVQEGDEPIPGETVGELYAQSPHAARVTQHFGDSAKFDYSPFLGKMDLVLVDGAHTFEYAKADSHTALSLVAPGGVIVWDDCAHYHAGVPRALVDFAREGNDVSRITGTRLAALPSARRGGRFARGGAAVPAAEG